MRVDVEDCEFDDALVLYNDEPLTGILYANYLTGDLEEELTYSNGLPHGDCKQWYKSGVLKSEWHSVNGRAEGEYREYHENAKLKLFRIAEFGVTLSTKEYDSTGNLVKEWALPENDHMYQYVLDCRNI